MLRSQRKAEILFEDVLACSRSYKKLRSSTRLLSWITHSHILHCICLCNSCQEYLFTGLICLSLTFFNGLLRLSPPNTSRRREAGDTLAQAVSVESQIDEQSAIPHEWITKPRERIYEGVMSCLIKSVQLWRAFCDTEPFSRQVRQGNNE